jgi:hypothetical protein
MEQERPVSERGPRPAAIAVHPADGSVVEAAPRRLSWPPGERAEDYRVVLYDDASTPIWESGRSRSPAVELPEDVRARLPPGRVVYWRFVTHAGIEQSRSPLFRFTVRAGAPK